MGSMQKPPAETSLKLVSNSEFAEGRNFTGFLLNGGSISEFIGKI